MNIKQELQNLKNKLDKTNRKLAGAKERGDQAIAAQAKAEKHCSTDSTGK